MDERKVRWVGRFELPRTYLKKKIGIQGKARNSRKSGAYKRTSYVSILNRFATPPWALRLF